MTYNGRASAVGCRPAKTLVDSASEGNLVNDEFARSIGATIYDLPEPIPLYNGDGKLFGVLRQRAIFSLILGGHVEAFEAFLVPLPRYNVVCGLPWFHTHNPAVDWPEYKLTMHSSHCLNSCIESGVPLTLCAKPSDNTNEESHFSSYSLPDQDPDIEAVDLRLVSASNFFHIAADRAAVTFALFPDRLSFSASTITGDDFEKHLQGPKRYTLKQIKKRLPRKLRPFADLFLRENADALPPHRPEDHKIDLKPDAPLPTVRSYKPLSLAERQALKKALDDLIEKGYIRPSSSSAISPVLLVRKPNGGIRMCIDYRRLNDITIRQKCPIPMLSETLSNLSQASIFSNLDIIHAFNTIRIREGDEWKTSFSTRYGQFEFLVMPFGLTNAPATFQNFVNDAVRPGLDDHCTAYLDDILVYSKNIIDHEKHLVSILERLRARRLFLDIDKCSFFTTKVTYLGLEISTEGIKVNSSKVETVRHWPTPKNNSELHTFIGMANHYRRFIPDFARLTRPLQHLINCKVHKGLKGKARVSYPPFVWTPDCAAAFEKLKDCFCSAPLLAHYDPSKPTVIETDASDLITAGVLSQLHPDGLRPVAFFSKRMSSAEGNYAIYDKELLAIIRALELWKPELLGLHEPFDVLTDHQSLKYFMSTKNLSARQARWAEFLSQFHFVIKYRPGRQNAVPDVLSRHPDLSQAHKEQLLSRTRTLLDESVLDPDLKAALNCLWFDNVNPTCYNSMSFSSLHFQPMSASTPSPDTAPDVVDCDIEPLDLNAVREASAADDTIQSIVHCLQDPSCRRLPGHLVRSGIRFSLGDFVFSDDLLYVQGRLFVPNTHDIRLTILHNHHDSRLFGHPSQKTLFRLISHKYYWPGLRASCDRYVASCRTCRRSKPSNATPGFLNPLPLPSRPWLDITVDLAEDLPVVIRRGRAFKHVLVVVDRFSKDRIFEPLTSKEASEIVECLHRRVFCQHGYPLSIVSDRGSQFTSELYTQYARLFGINIILASAQHPETDGQSESSVKYLKTFLRSFTHYAQSDWVDFLPDAEFASRLAPSAATGLSPFFTLHGFHPRTPSDPVESLPAHRRHETVPEIVARTRQVYNWILDNLAWYRDQMTDQANSHRVAHPLIRPGDSVYVDSRFLPSDSSRPRRSLAPKRYGPWKVLRSLDNKAFVLDIPEDLKANGLPHTFHPSKLRLASDPLPGQPTPVAPEPEFPDPDDLEPEWEVDSIVACRSTKRFGVQYKATYKGPWDEWNSRPPWQPWQDFVHAPQKVLDFHANNPDAPQPPDYFLT